MLTEPEKRLWWHIRYRLPVEDSHFRRQVAIGPYVADFCCLAARLVVEVDGGQHSVDRNAAYDATRTGALGAQGYRVLCFTNAEVMTDIDVVLDTIFAALSPPPCGEERRVPHHAARADPPSDPTHKGEGRCWSPECPTPTTSSSSAPAPAATWPRSARRSSGSRPRWSTASISAASA
ncbi:MAG TPA: DUF559 domain-containing protein [Methylobacterium sp.]